MRSIPEKDTRGDGPTLGGFIVALLLLTSAYILFVSVSYCMGVASVQRDAVKHGHARFVATDLGYTRFEWKEINNGK